MNKSAYSARDIAVLGAIPCAVQVKSKNAPSSAPSERKPLLILRIGQNGCNWPSNGRSSGA